jgi:predicted membrane protein
MPINLKEFRKQLTYQQSATPVVISRELKDIAKVDRLAEIEQKKYGKFALYFFLGVLGTIILIFTTSTFLTSSNSIAIVTLLLFLLAIGLSIAFTYSLSRRIYHAKFNLPNYRYDLANNLLNMLTRDINKASNIDVYLSFIASTDKQYKQSTIPHPSRSGWKIDCFQHEWLRMQGQFLDKTRFTLTATALSKTQYGWKRGRSGKNKYKSKTKPIGLDVGLTLNYSQKQYGAIKVLKNEINAAIKVPIFCQIRNIKVTDKSIHLSLRISPHVADKSAEIYEAITTMFLSLYQVLNLAKVLSK